jgi:hypothetical protein
VSGECDKGSVLAVIADAFKACEVELKAHSN